MAYQMGISQNAYNLIENGKTKITIQHFIDISRALELEVTFLLVETLKIQEYR